MSKRKSLGAKRPVTHVELGLTRLMMAGLMGLEVEVDILVRRLRERQDAKLVEPGGDVVRRRLS